MKKVADGVAEHPLLVASQYGRGGSSTRVRVYDWLEYLGISHVERFEYRGVSSNSPQSLLKDLPGSIRAERERWRLVQRAKNSTTILSRELSPLSQGRNEEKLLRSAQRGVYDFDDALYARFPGTIGRFYSRSRVWKRSVSAADVVIAGSEILAERAQLHNPNVIMIPSCVDHTQYQVKSDFEQRTQPLAVWIGSPATEPYLRIAQEGLMLAHAATGLRLKVISAGSASLGPLDKIVERVPWHPSTYSSSLADADFGIMPLPNDEWSQGKCAYKLLQYGAAGIPVVGSPVGANKTALQRLGGFSATNDHEWRDVLIDLARSSSVDQADRGRAARLGVAEHYSFEAWQDRWKTTVLP
ncbi:hypothetical protein ACR5KS_03315 [Leucobacter sp. W1153]